MLNLLLKDFKLMFSQKAKRSERILSVLFVALFIGCFVAIELFVFTAIINKVSSIASGKEAFLSVFLFVITVLSAASSVLAAKKLFFTPKDTELLSNRPVKSSQIIMSKIIILFVTQTFIELIFVYPLLAAYGSAEGKTPLFFFTSLFYPIFSFFAEAGIALLLVYPAYLLSKLLKNRPIVKLVLSSVVLAVLAVFYVKALEIFVNLAAGNGMGALFDSANIARLNKFGEVAYPVNFLTDIFLGKSFTAFLTYFLISSVIFAAGVTVTVLAYNYVRNVDFAVKKNGAERKPKVVSVTKTLIKKELSLIFLSSENIFSYTGLIVVQPFLLAMILKAMNSIFGSGTIAYYTGMIPGFTAFVDAFFVVIFSTTIAGGANRFISTEKSTVKNIKTMPVEPKYQLLIKLAIPYAVSVASLLVTVIVLACAGTLSVLNALFVFLLAATALAMFMFVSLYEELKIRHGVERKTGLSSAASLAMPVLFAACSVALSLLGVSPSLCFAIGIVVYVCSAVLCGYAVYKKSDVLFSELEAVN